MDSPHRIEIIQVFEGELSQATAIQQLLVEFDIPAFLFNERSNDTAEPAVNAGVADRVSVLVSDEYQDRSLKLIEEYNNSTPLNRD